MTHIGIATLLGAAAIVVSAGRVDAELPPQAYEAMRQQARHVLILRIQSVDRSAPKVRDGMRSVGIAVRARILSVVRGKGLSMGETVTVRYVHRSPTRAGWVGPAPIPVLEPGTRVLAWLSPGGDGLAPAARGRSFTVLR